MTKTRNPWIKQSKWYGKEVAKDFSREEKRFITAPKAKSIESECKAIAYALWIAQRDGAKIPKDSCKIKVNWQKTLNGWRPRSVFWLPEEPSYRSQVRGEIRKFVEPLLEIELPNWSYEAPEPVEIAD